jgi:hypothetical protein
VGKGAHASSCVKKNRTGRKSGGSSDFVSFYTNAGGRQQRGGCRSWTPFGERGVGGPVRVGIRTEWGALWARATRRAHV